MVERKTFEGLLVDFGKMDILRQRLLELSAFEQHAVVVEARYEDFLSPEKVHHWSAAFCARAIADLYALFPRLRLVFCSNRKTAAEWTRSYFAAVWSVRGHVEATAGQPAVPLDGIDHPPGSAKGRGHPASLPEDVARASLA